MPRRFVNYPTHQVLAVFDDSSSADAADAALREGGIPDAAIVRFSGAEDVDRLGGLGARSGRLARLLRTVQFMTMDQMPDFVLYEEAVRGGRVVAAVRVPDAGHRRFAIDVLRRNGAHFVNYYGRFATEEITMWRGPEPSIPGYLRR